MCWVYSSFELCFLSFTLAVLVTSFSYELLLNAFVISFFCYTFVLVLVQFINI